MARGVARTIPIPPRCRVVGTASGGPDLVRVGVSLVAQRLSLWAIHGRRTLIAVGTLVGQEHLSLIGYLVWIKTASPFLYKELAGRIAWASSLDRHILYASHRAEAAFLKADPHAGRPKEAVAGIPTRPYESNE
jgi:hypothetical protein